MMRVMNLGALTRHPVYRVKRAFRGLGQDDWADVNPDAGISTDVMPSIPDWGSSVDTGAPVTSSGALDAGSGQSLPSMTTSESTPSQLSPSLSPAAPAAAPGTGSSGAAPSSGAAAAGTDALSTIGKFFTSLFTPSTVAAAAAAIKAGQQPKTPAPLLTLPIGSQGIPITTGTLLVVGGVILGGVALVTVLKP